MSKFPAGLACAVLATLCVTLGRAQDPNFAAVLSFESGQLTRAQGWSVSAGAALDGETVHRGKWSARIEGLPGDSGQTAGITRDMAIEFAGKVLEMRGVLRAEKVDGAAGLWMRQSGDSGVLALANMDKREVRGTTDWQEYSITLPVHPQARRLSFGVFLTGKGRVWVDDLQLLVDGKPIQEAPRAERPRTALDTDREFDAGSGITLTALSPVQIENLVTLGKVWGFLKYHHPGITGGGRHWDYDLFRVMPAVLAAADRQSSHAAMAKWIDGLGPIPACQPCAVLESADMHLGPPTQWIEDQRRLGPELTRALRAAYANRPADGKQFYLGKAPGVGNPEFRNEPAYPAVKAGDAGYQILASYRYWNMVEYWFPYRDVLGEDWDGVLRGAVAKIALAKTGAEYRRELMALIAHAHDTHSNLWSSLADRPPVGPCQAPVTVRFVENQAVVAGTLGGVMTDLQRGDAILEMDGVPIEKLMAEWKPYYAVSNEAAWLRDLGRQMTRGACGGTTMRVRRESGSVAVNTSRVRIPEADLNGARWHDLPGDTFQKLSEEVAYLKLSSIKTADVPGYIDRAAGTKGLIIDIRNYPSEFSVFSLGALLVEKQTPFARFTTADLANPGAFRWGESATVYPRPPRYSGKVVILVDEVSQSQSEYTTMAFRTVPGAKVVGSTTAGADGNVSAIPLPGGLRSMISGIGVFYPDKAPTQRVGIVPDVEKRPTIAGIRAGRDEVLEEAIRQILGREVSAEEMKKMSGR